jgi:hypothetical protein
MRILRSQSVQRLRSQDMVVLEYSDEFGFEEREVREVCD